MNTTTPSTTETPTRRTPRMPRRWMELDLNSTALGTVGDVSLELGQRSYRVVLNCASTNDPNSRTVTVPETEPHHITRLLKGR